MLRTINRRQPKGRVRQLRANPSLGAEKGLRQAAGLRPHNGLRADSRAATGGVTVLGPSGLVAVKFSLAVGIVA